MEIRTFVVGEPGRSWLSHVEADEQTWKMRHHKVTHHKQTKRQTKNELELAHWY